MVGSSLAIATAALALPAFFEEPAAFLTWRPPWPSSSEEPVVDAADLALRFLVEGTAAFLPLVTWALVVGTEDFVILADFLVGFVFSFPAAGLPFLFGGILIVREQSQ